MEKFESMPRLLRCFNYKNPPGNSDDFRTLPRPIGSMVFVAEGEADYLTEGSSFRLKTGDILFIPIGGTYISYWENYPSQLLCFHFTMPSDFERRYPVQKITGHSELKSIFAEAIESAVDDFRACELFYSAAGKIWNELVTVETHIDPRIRPALDYLELSPERECSVAELAGLCHMSESHFYSCFRKSMGRAPMEYRTELLIMNAQRMLASTELSISEVAEQLGFGSETYFRRIFKSKVGISPREFRKNPLK